MDTIAQGMFDFALVDGYAWNPCMAVLSAYFKIPFGVWSSTLHPYHIHATFDATVPAFGACLSSDMSSMERFWNMWYYMNSDVSHFHDPFLLERLPFPVKSWGLLLRKARLFIASVDGRLAWQYKPMKGFLRVPGLTTGEGKQINGTLATVVSSKSNGL